MNLSKAIGCSTSITTYECMHVYMYCMYVVYCVSECLWSCARCGGVVPEVHTTEPIFALGHEEPTET